MREREAVALVIGGAGGIGSQVVSRLRTRGLDVLATYRGEEMTSTDSGVRWLRLDVTDEASASAVAAYLASHCGPLRAVVYAAGTPSSKRLVADTPSEEFRSLFAVNALGLVTVWRAIRDLARGAKARLVVVGSDATRAPSPRNGPYTASKAALEAISMTLASEEAVHEVRVNVIAPALVETPQAYEILRRKGVANPAEYFSTLPWGRALSPAEVADVVVDLAVDEHWSYPTGQIFRLAT